MPFAVKDIGSFYVGGRQVSLSGLPIEQAQLTKGSPPVTVDPNGEFMSGQMYVQYVRQENPKAKYPLLLWHGGGLSGTCFETTPDGRPGWQMFFLNQGHDVYVSDSVERGRASWSQYPDIYPGKPLFRTKKQAWETFRIGYSYEEGTYREATQFPMEAFDEFMKQSIPRWACNDALTEAAYAEYLRKMGKSVILAHSQGCGFAVKAALEAPERVAALILVESSGVPDLTGYDLSSLKHIPHLFVWGDYVYDGKSWWGDFCTLVHGFRDKLAAAGVDADWLVLPEIGITGNSHMLIMEKNSDAIAAKLQDWMTAKNLMRDRF